MEVATGCTEPAAIALCAAYAREQLIGMPSYITVRASANIIKNAMAAGIPGTEYTGTNYAAALGALAGRTERYLQVIDVATAEERSAAAELVKEKRVMTQKKDTGERLYIEAELRDDEGHIAKAIIAAAHTNLVYLEADGRVVLDRREDIRTYSVSPESNEGLSIHSIVSFADTIDRDTDDLHMIEKAIEINRKIAEEGARRNFNLCIGRNISAMEEAGYIKSDMVTEATRRTACGIDARMGGANMPVVTNSGSGNQGITATVPVLTAAEYLRCGNDRTFKAVVISHLISIYIHRYFGLLSALCGATVAGTGAACGITYLMGGGEKEIGYCINNMMGCVTGMLCDGAKSDCAMKVAACINMAFLSASMAMRGVYVQPNEGIVDCDPARTVSNFVRLGNEGSPLMDSIMLDIMTEKENNSMIR
ncbi:MAG: serine dehydratase subunit alpha family protein [Christensenellales bacterium]